MFGVKQVRFIGINGETTHNLEDATTTGNPERKPVDLCSLLREPAIIADNSTERQPTTKKKKKKKKKKSEFQKLKAEKNELVKELKRTKSSIKEDSERKLRSADYSPFENRQRLARSTGAIHSKVKQLEGKISTKEKLRREKIQKSFKTKIKTTTIKAEKQHGRLIDLTSKLGSLKLDEDQLRYDIHREKRLSSLSAQSTSSCHNNDYEIIPPENEEMERWVELSEKSKTEDGNAVIDKEDDFSATGTRSPELELYRIGSSLSSVAETELSLEEKELKANKLARKYDFTRELRNTIHQHMISRSYCFSYTNIIPPYKHKKEKPVKTKQSYNRAIYEDKLNVLEFAKRQKKLPALT